MDIDVYYNEGGDLVVRQNEAWWSSRDVAHLVIDPDDADELVAKIRAALKSRPGTGNAA